MSEYLAYLHDKDYDALGLRGPEGVFGTTAAAQSDLNLAVRSSKLMIFNNSILDRQRAHAVTVSFGIIGTVKQILAPVENASSYIQRKSAGATLNNMAPNLPFSPF